MTPPPKGHLLRATPVEETKFRTPTTMSDLRYYLQAALALEHLTIPPYLTALYTLDPRANRDAFHVIRSVVVEEMLHMALVANVLNAVGGTPRVADPRFVKDYPAVLPYSFDREPVALRHFSVEAVKTFLRIEQPEQNEGVPEEIPATSSDGWTSIGQFYATIGRALSNLVQRLGHRRVFSGAPERQVHPEAFYNSGGAILTVTDLPTALGALECISVQGEGADGTIWDGDDIMFGEAPEVSHYFRFKQLLGEQRYTGEDTPRSGPSGPLLVVDWARTFKIDPLARIADFEADPLVHRAAREFNVEYAVMLVLLDRAFAGDPVAMPAAIARMLRLRDLAVQLYRSPHPDDEKRRRGLHASATFEVAAIDLQRARHRLASET